MREVGDVKCGRCGLPQPGSITGEFRCSNCHGLELGFDRAVAAVVATPFLLDIVHRYKYRRALWFEGFLVELLVGVASRVLVGESWDAVVLCLCTGFGERGEGVQSVRTTGPSDGRSAWDFAAAGPGGIGGPRREPRPCSTEANGPRMWPAHSPGRPPSAWKGWWAAVVDDVLTTGATTSAVGWVLREAGASAVTVLTVARGI